MDAFHHPILLLLHAAGDVQQTHPTVQVLAHDCVPLRVRQHQLLWCSALDIVCCQMLPKHAHARWHLCLQIFCSFGIDCLEALSGTCTMYLSKRSSRQVPCSALHHQDHTSRQVQQQANALLCAAYLMAGAC